jgi:hypothetical protein
MTEHQAASLIFLIVGADAAPGERPELVKAVNSRS